MLPEIHVFIKYCMITKRSYHELLLGIFTIFIRFFVYWNLYSFKVNDSAADNLINRFFMMCFMFAKPVIIALFFLCWVVPSYAQLRYYAPFDLADWEVRSSPYACELVQTIPGFGEAVFFQKAGEQRFFKLNSLYNELQAGVAKLQIRKPIWQDFKLKHDLGTVSIIKDDETVVVKGKRAERLIEALYGGMSPAIVQKNTSTNKSVYLALSSINFRDSMVDFRSCLAKLLPVNYEQIERTRITFDKGAPLLDKAAKQRLDHIISYISEDKSVNRFYIDGHSDSEGKRLANLEFSKQRAELVSDYLMNNGVPKDNIIVRYHGERYPVVKNNTPKNRRMNRRVTIRLEQNAPPIVKAEPATPSEPAIESVISDTNIADEVAGDIKKGLGEQAVVESVKKEG